MLRREVQGNRIGVCILFRIGYSSYSEQDHRVAKMHQRRVAKYRGGNIEFYLFIRTRRVWIFEGKTRCRESHYVNGIGLVSLYAASNYNPMQHN
jgi:hypothetical protein